MQNLTLIEILNLEKELELLKKKVRIKFHEPGIQTKIHTILGIDYNQLCNFRAGRREFGIKRLLKIAKLLAR